MIYLGIGTHQRMALLAFAYGMDSSWRWSGSCMTRRPCEVTTIQPCSRKRYDDVDVFIAALHVFSLDFFISPNNHSPEYLCSATSLISSLWSLRYCSAVCSKGLPIRERYNPPRFSSAECTLNSRGFPPNGSHAVESAIGSCPPGTTRRVEFNSGNVFIHLK